MGVVRAGQTLRAAALLVVRRRAVLVFLEYHAHEAHGSGRLEPRRLVVDHGWVRDPEWVAAAVGALVWRRRRMVGSESGRLVTEERSFGKLRGRDERTATCGGGGSGADGSVDVCCGCICPLTVGCKWHWWVSESLDEWLCSR